MELVSKEEECNEVKAKGGGGEIFQLKIKISIKSGDNVANIVVLDL